MNEATSEFGKILVAVDGSKQSMRAIDVGISLARKYDSLLTALYVIHIPFGETIYPRAIWHKEFIEDINTETRTWFEDIRDKGKKSEVSIELTMKETAESIPAQIIKYANERNFDLVVVGSKGKTGLEKLFLGSVAAGVLAYALCPVLVVR